MMIWIIFFAAQCLLLVGAVGDEESLYVKLNITKKDGKEAGFGKQRVTFSSNQDGVKREDLVLSNEQENWLFGDNEPWLVQDHMDVFNYTTEVLFTHERKKRAGTEIKPGIAWWPQARVPYIINERDFTEEQITQLKQAMAHYEEVSCLQFVKRTNEKQWIYIHHTDDGCYSLLGDARNFSPGAQPLSLQEPGCRQFGTYLHELGHAIGLVHEHQLPTRNNHVRYYATNVDPLSADQLEIYNPRVVKTFNTPYDLGSIMHYSITAFAVDDTSMTLGIDNMWLAQHIGRRFGDIISFGDAKAVNYLYKCPILKGCSATKLLQCPKGYVDKNCDCIEPLKYHETYCKDAPGFEKLCNELAPSGNCDFENIDHHRHCRRTCGFCPRFFPGETAIGPKRELEQRSCIDRYPYPAKCKMWKNYCTTSKWMMRYCRLSCGMCGKNIMSGNCANQEYDLLCDRYKRMRLCNREGSNRAFVRTKCPDSCNACGWKKIDESCRNKASDEECLKYAKEEACERNPVKMYDQCPSTCNRCYWNAGSCQNRSNDAECMKMALQNLCTHGGLKQAAMRQQCGKTCDSCSGK